MTDYKNIINPFGGHLQKVVSDSHISSVAASLSFKDGVTDVASLPAIGNTINDARIVNDTHNLYIWNGSSWINQGDILNIDWSNITNKPIDELNAAKGIIITLCGNAYNYIFTNNLFYTIFNKFCFCGTAVAGSPTNIKIIAHIEKAEDLCSVRIYDVTNSKVICEKTGINNTASQVIDLGTLSNLPTAEAVFEIQAKSTDGDEIRISSLAVEF